MSESNRIDRDEVRRIAALARLTVDDTELEALTADLVGILAYADKLKEIDVTQVPATAHAIELDARLREDRVVSGLRIDESLKNAPERIADGFGVPKIIE